MNTFLHFIEHGLAIFGAVALLYLVVIVLSKPTYDDGDDHGTEP